VAPADQKASVGCSVKWKTNKAELVARADDVIE
jgi:hypothetical protein